MQSQSGNYCGDSNPSTELQQLVQPSDQEQRQVDSDCVVESNPTGTNGCAAQQTNVATHEKVDNANGTTGEGPAGSTRNAEDELLNSTLESLEISAVAYSQDDNELGSDQLDDTILENEKMVDYQKVLDQCGYTELMNMLDENNNKWRDIKISIAITGQSGSGKSSFINALRGLKDEDKDAAETGCVETTIYPKPYPHPDNKNLVLWDLPGVGTRNNPQETYLQTVNFKKYDFIILVSSNRFTEHDTYLAKHIQFKFDDPHLFFVRSKIDVDLENKQKGRRIPMTEKSRQETLDEIKKNCDENLMKDKIQSPLVFMINNHDTHTFDFKTLANTLVDKVKELKRDALVLSIAPFTEKIVDAKVDALNRRLNDVAGCAAVAALHSKREEGERLEIDILKKEMLMYKRQLGIDTHSLNVVAGKFKKDIQEIYIALNSETHAILRKFDDYCARADKVVPSELHGLQVLKNNEKLYERYQRQWSSVLKKILHLCIKENITLQRKIVEWSHT
ncbi:interferon-inducible GTPase 1-like isoform X2 [Dreissena polymorpha]|uniref:IRG-type G domain-containing protein n=1 Tax=Dreissena polymorpha TaxID=45954 RepID=A0A9D4LYM8_DREPO|nr:interferon-inducible GTPase 1-like isoform X2 [Dreissena polymorpha]KAH3866344.1 hypothetical protein DPMN_029406 [Dreissena polymorpha]